jgi:hypothetical protein
LVVVAICLVVLIGVTAFAVDLARLYSAVGRLRVATDAAALSGVTDLRRNITEETVADLRALALRRTNTVNGQTLQDADMGAADIEPGRWSFTTRTFVPSSWTTASAVRATARYRLPWTMARLFGETGQLITTRSIAAVAAPLRSGCLKPWAVPYTNMLVTLGRSATDTAYRLTQEDVTMLRENRMAITFKITSNDVAGGSATVGGTVINGNYYAVRYPPVQYADGTPGQPVGGASEYRAAIQDLGCTASGTAAVGDWLDMAQGNMTGPTRQGVGALCGSSGNSFTCDADILVPIWSNATSSGGSTWVRILYIGAFRLTQFNNGAVSGYLTSLAATGTNGGFSPFPGPVTVSALVQ